MSVVDQGLGMTEEQIKNVFDPLVQARDKTSKNLNPLGNGLGLSICKQICQCLDGDIHVRSQPNLGSKFTFSMKVLNPANNGNEYI